MKRYLSSVLIVVFVVALPGIYMLGFRSGQVRGGEKVLRAAVEAKVSGSVDSIKLDPGKVQEKESSESTKSTSCAEVLRVTHENEVSYRLKIHELILGSLEGKNYGVGGYFEFNEVDGDFNKAIDLFNDISNQSIRGEISKKDAKRLHQRIDVVIVNSARGFVKAVLALNDVPYLDLVRHENNGMAFAYFNPEDEALYRQVFRIAKLKAARREIFGHKLVWDSSEHDVAQGAFRQYLLDGLIPVELGISENQADVSTNRAWRTLKKE